MSSHLMTDLEPLNLTPDLIASARLTVAERATDAADARRLLQMIGLLPTRRERPEARDDMGRMRSGTYRKDHG